MKYNITQEWLTQKYLLVLETTDHNRLHRAISKGFETRERQINWLIDNGILFVEIK
jgi:hypothetical protein